jgi:hypothetical protein
MAVTNCQWSISQQREQIEKVVPPPKDCRIFVLINEEKSSVRINPGTYQLDAWMIAAQYHRYTVNGYSGNFPWGWWDMWDPNLLLHYCKGIQEWCRKNNLTDIYAYNPMSNEWIPPNALTQKIPTLINKMIPKFEYAQRINFPNPDFIDALVSGWNGAGVSGVWSDGNNAVLRFSMKTKGQKIRVCIGGLISHDGNGLKVSIVVNGQHIKDDVLLDIHNGYYIEIPEKVLSSDNGQITIEFKIGNPKSPYELGQSTDKRKLGIQLQWFEIQHWLS